jgi:hypothetical protein
LFVIVLLLSKRIKTVLLALNRETEVCRLFYCY